jgi:Family of unknown function (DUF6519)
MKGDFTRVTFDPKKHYQQVLMQQGRAQIDADSNEQGALVEYRAEAMMADVVGKCGGPADGAAFGVSTDASLGGGDFLLGAGHYYVDGILVENDDSVAYTEQPDRVDVAPLEKGKSYLLVLDVWQRHITALEDPAIREPALGGPDTTTRVQTVWQVRALLLDWIDPDKPCGSGDFDSLKDPGTAKLTASTASEAATDDPCLVPPSAGYRGQENQLYRVEIHNPGKANAGATWKWSRENGSVVAAIEKFDGKQITVSSLGPDTNLGFVAEAWVEILDDTLELEGKPGQLVQIDSVDESTRIVTLKADATALPANDRHPKLRRWEGVGPVTSVSDPSTDWSLLESGVQVRFVADGDYRTGQYWQIPARTATAQSSSGIEWPLDSSGNPVALAPKGITHHFCRLGVVEVGEKGEISSTDCRCLYPALTAVPRLYYVGGGGQEVSTDAPATNGFYKLPRPLVVGVANAQCLEKPLTVGFAVTEGNGGVVASGGAADAAGTIVHITTDFEGLAKCDFYLDPDEQNQQVTATLVDEFDRPVSLPIFFEANLSTGDGSCCCKTVGPDGDFRTLQDALTTLLKQGVSDICLCMMSGDHTVEGLLVDGSNINNLNLHISGCGRGSRIVLTDLARFVGLSSVVLREVDIFAKVSVESGASAIAFVDCDEVTVDACRVAGLIGLVPGGKSISGALLDVSNARSLRLQDSLVEAALPESLNQPKAIFAPATTAFVAKLFEYDPPDFNTKVVGGAEKIKALDPEGRKSFSDAMKGYEENPALSPAEKLSYANLDLAVANTKTDIGTLIEVLQNIRTAAIEAKSGLAVVLGETPPSSKDAQPYTGQEDDWLLLQNNKIIGGICLQGQPVGRQVEGSDVSGAGYSTRGMLGTVLLCGNQLTQIAASEGAINTLKSTQRMNTVPPLRVTVTDNIIGSDSNQILGKLLSLGTNKFTLSAVVPTKGIVVGISVADNAVFLGNQGPFSGVDWKNYSRVSGKAANIEVNVS